MKLIELTETKLPVPKKKQTTDYTCGPAAVICVLRYYDPNVDKSEKDLSKLLDTSKEWGTDIPPMVELGKKLGMKSYAKSMDVDEVVGLLKQGHPVILNIQDWHEPGPAKGYENGHFVVAVGFEKNGFHIMDPLGGDHRSFITFDDLLDRWYGGDEKRTYKQFGIVMIPQ